MDFSHDLSMKLLGTTSKFYIVKIDGEGVKLSIFTM